MKYRNIYLICFVLSAVASVTARNASRFESYPEERQHFIDYQSERSSRNRKEAEAWAKARGKPMRFKQGGRLYELAAIRNGKPAYRVTHNARAAISSSGNLVRESPFNLTGSGVSVGIWDGGEPLTSHIEFGGRVTYAPGETRSLDDHATHVTGTIAASGVNTTAKGMAPAVSVISYDWGDDLAEMAAKGASAANQSSRIYLSNHSYGWDVGFLNKIEFGQYSDNSRDVDQLVHNLQYYLPFFSAGNDANEDAYHNDGGFETISHYAVCKNVITVGAVNDAVSGNGAARSISAATIADFSSRGPCDDGRIKPDIVANGVELMSTYTNSIYSYLPSSGTSMASPSACGSAALLVEYYNDLFGGAMRASTLKGLIIHTADDLGNSGPDYTFGWGLMNTKAAADLLKNIAEVDAFRLMESSLSYAQPENTYTIFSDGIEPLRITLCWTDPAAIAQDAFDNDRSPDLVHDLDLSIIGPDGEIYYPYKLNYAAPAAIATAAGKNNIDNVEQIYIPSPAIGYYSVQIHFAGAVPGNTQSYSMLSSGVSNDSDGDGIPDFWELDYFGSTTGAVASVDFDHDGADNLTEYISGHDPLSAASVFKVSSFEATTIDGTPFIITWEPEEGRVYNVLWTENLLYSPLTDHNLSGDLYSPVNSYTDSVLRAVNAGFYRIEVRLK